MSWLNIRGKIYHCTECNNEIKVEYEGGACPTLIGDMNVIQQISLNEKYSTISHSPVSEEYYFHDTSGICERCFSNYDTKGSQDILNMYIELRRSYENYYDEFQELLSNSIFEYINNLSKDKFGEIDINSYNDTIGHKFFKLTSKRDKLIEEFIMAIREKIINELNEVLHTDNRLAEVIKLYNDKTEELNNSILKSLEEYKGKFFYEKHIDETENLNDLIEHQFAVRKPESATPKLKFYYELDQPKTTIREELESFDTHMWYSFDENEVIKKVKEKLYQVL